jgi:hypothetical protein
MAETAETELRLTCQQSASNPPAIRQHFASTSPALRQQTSTALLRLRQSRQSSSPVVPIRYGDVQRAAPEVHREGHLEERKRLSRNPMKMLLGHRRRPRRSTGIQHWLPSIGSILQRACTTWLGYRILSLRMKNSEEPTWLAVELAIQSQFRITATRWSFDARC